MKFRAEFFSVLIRQAENLRVFYTVDVNFGNGLIIICPVVCNPPIFHAELNDMKFPGLVCVVRFQTSIKDKIIVLDSHSFLNEELMLLEFSFNEMR